MFTDMSFIQPGKSWPPDQDLDELARQDEYTKNKRLYDGDHYLIWTDLNNTEDAIQKRLNLNLFKTTCTTFSDFLIGEPPIYDTDQPDTLNRIIENNNYHSLTWDVSTDTQRYGVGVYKIRFDGTQGIIERVPPSIWYPVFQPDNAQDYQAHVIAYEFVTPYQHIITQRFLRVEIHTRGQIENHIYMLQGGIQSSGNPRLGGIYNQPILRGQGGVIGAEVPLNAIPRYAALLPKQPTGLVDFCVFPVYNTPEASSDLQSIEDIVHELERRGIQISHILDKHADPSMAGPDSEMEEDPETGELRYKAEGKYFPISDNAKYPQYITWDGQLPANQTFWECLMQMFFINSELTPAALGQVSQGMADSGSALRRLLVKPLARVNRLRMRMGPTFKKVLINCSMLEQFCRMQGAVPITKLKVTWQDGLPLDMLEVAKAEQMKKNAGLTSVAASLKRMEGLEGVDLQNELAAIANDLQTGLSRPSINFQGTPVNPTNPGVPQPGGA